VRVRVIEESLLYFVFLYCSIRARKRSVTSKGEEDNERTKNKTGIMMGPLRNLLKEETF